MRLTIAFKLFLGFGVVVAMLAAAGGLSAWQLRSTAAAYDQEMDQEVVSVLLVQQTDVLWLTQVKSGKDALLRGHDADALATYVKQFTDQGNTVRDNVAKLKGAEGLTPEEKSLLTEFEAGQTVYEATFQKSLDVMRKGSANAYRDADALIKGQDKAATEAMDKLAAGVMKRAEADSEQLLAGAESSSNGALAVLMVALLAGIAVAALLSRSISRGVNAVGDAAERLSIGDFQQVVKVESRDEIGRMAAAFSSMIEYLKSMAAAADAISRGDLTQQVQPRSDRDALGIAFERMIANLRSTIGSVSSSAGALAMASSQLSAASEQAGAATQQIATTIQQVAGGNQETSASVQETSASVDQLTRAIDQIASGAQDQTRSIEQTAASVANLNSSISQVVSATREVSSAGEQAHLAAISGADSVDKTARGMEAIKSSTGVVAERIAELGSYSEQIGAIVEAIDDIAEQTNLLALNAAIEAARAGEHGRGFAVVADEVRKLAERAGKSTKEIAGLIGQIQKGTHEAVSAVERGSREVESGAVLADEAAKALRKILEAVGSANTGVVRITSAAQQMESASREVVSLMDSVSAVVEESTAATQEMAASSQQVRGAVEKVAAVSEETSASAEEVSASTEEMSAQVEEVVALAQSLSEMADQLQEAVSQFRLESGRVRCWDILQCDQTTRAKCPAQGSAEDRCWLIPNTWCGGVLQGDAASKRHNCMNCKAFGVISGFGSASGREPGSGVIQRRRSTDWAESKPARPRSAVIA